MISLPLGVFTMGSPSTEVGRKGNEDRLERVTVAPFAISKTEITFRQWGICVIDRGCSHIPFDSDWGRAHDQ